MVVSKVRILYLRHLFLNVRFHQNQIKTKQKCTKLTKFKTIGQTNWKFLNTLPKNSFIYYCFIFYFFFELNVHHVSYAPIWREAKSAWRITHTAHAAPHAPNMHIKLFTLSQTPNFLSTLNSVETSFLFSTYGHVLSQSLLPPFLLRHRSFSGPEPHHRSVRDAAASTGALWAIRAGLHAVAGPAVLWQPQATLHAAAPLPLHAAKRHHFELVSYQQLPCSAAASALQRPNRYLCLFSW